VVFEAVCSQLEAEGYEVQPLIIPACAIGAQIRRDRIWFIGILSNSCRVRFEGNKKLQERQQYPSGRKAQRIIDPLYSISPAEYRRGESTIVGGVNGVSSELDELEAFGNAIVPQVAFEIFKTIKKVEETK
jgi:DNA (cytosine-5)-methyltransferase 1